MPRYFITSIPSNMIRNYDVNNEHLCNGVVHPDTGKTITQYNKLNKKPTMMKIWTTAFGKKYGRMSQGDKKNGTKGNNSIFSMSHDSIDNIPEDWIVTYSRIVVNFWPQK